MATTARTRVLKLADPEPTNPFDASSEVMVDGDQDGEGSTLQDGVLITVHADGGATVDFNPDLSDKSADSKGFDRNLANELEQGKLDSLASDLLEGIRYDEDSRKEWLETRAKGISLLGLKIEEPRGDTGSSSAPLEGMSTIRHPLLLEATIRFQANARSELLPSSGPVKVRNDATAPPVGVGHNGGPPIGDEVVTDDLGTALEKDMNHYLTVTASEYVPDTDRMLFYVGFGGDGFKKVYNCPLRRRPVSESVDAEDIIVSNAATDIRNCGRVTHKIRMRPSILKRMQIVGAYREVSLSLPTPEPANAVEQKKQEISGVKTTPIRREDGDYIVYESYCEIDLDEFAPTQFKGKGLPLPYRVTIEKESRQVLDVRRNWEEKDEQAMARHFFVQFPFIRGLGFYGLGLIHILGNVTLTLTACWRLMLDNGMFANFPGFLFAKQAGRQNSNQFRIPPGGGAPFDIGAMPSIRDAIMPLPYKETGPAFTAFATHVEEVGQRLGMTAEVNVGEGKQEVPVGTTMALIEQATKVIDSVHKRLHAAQAEEFGLLKERFKEDPEAFWRHNKKPTKEWTKQQFLDALNKWELVPVADPNNPTSLHRTVKAIIYDTLISKYPQLTNAKLGLQRIMRIIGLPDEGFVNAQAAPPPPDPRFAAIQAKAAAQAQMAQIQQMKVYVSAQVASANMQDKAAERAFKERMEQFSLYLEAMRVQQEMVIHAHDNMRDERQSQSDLQSQHAETANKLHLDGATKAHELYTGRQRHEAALTQGQQVHEQRLDQQQETHEQRLEQARAMAAAKPKTEGQ